MDTVGTFNHLIPSDQLEDSLLLGQNLECEASDEFASSHNLPGDSLKNMLSDKDPMFGSASSQFNLLENDDANFQISSSIGHDMNAAGFSQTCADGDKTPAKFLRGRRKDTTQLQRKQTAFSSRGRGRGGRTRRPGPFKGVSTEASKTTGLISDVKDDKKGSTSISTAEMHREKRDELLGRRFNANEVYPSMNPVVVLRRLTVTVGGYKIELLPGPSHISDSFDTSTIQTLSFQDDSITTERNGFGVEQTQAQAFEVNSVPELNFIQGGANEMAVDLGPYVNPNDVQHTNGATEVTTENKAVEQNMAEKPESDQSETKVADKKLLKPSRPLGTTKSKNLSRTGSLQKGSELQKSDKTVGKSTEENQQQIKTKPNSLGLKGPAVSYKHKQASKPQKEQVVDPVKHNVSSPVSRSPTVNRKVSSDSSPGAKVVINKSPSSAKKLQIPSPTGTKPSQSVKDGLAEEELEKAKIRKTDKTLQRQRSRSSRSISVDEPELFIPDNAPVVKKGSAEGDPTSAPENETAWDSSKQCGLCSKPHNNRFMVGCGRCDDWFHGDCIGLDLAKVQQMEKDDQEFVCLKCCADEGGKGNAENTDNSEAQQKQGPESSVTAGGIRPLRKDSEERRSSMDSAGKSGSSVKHNVKKAKISPPSIKKPSTGQIRRSVRDSLEEILLKRLKESDLKVSKEKPAELAKRTEKELFALFQGVDSKYKNKYRSLMFNLRDMKNNVLYKRVLKGEIPPRDLVRLSAEELASKELAAWRKRENRHTIEMIEKEQREAERRPVTKITHKGEIEIENQEPAKAPEALPDPVLNIVEVSEEKPPESKPESPKTAKDTTSLHKSHLFDLYCKICTGRMAPPVEEATTKAVKVATTVIRRQSTVTEPESHDSTLTSPPIVQSSALVDDLSLRAMEEGLLNFPDYESRLESASNKEDTAAFLSGLRTLWNGYIDMPSVARYLTKAYPVSGILDHLPEDLPETIQVGGRISPQTVWDYVEKIRASGTKEICVIRFTPDTEEDEISYTLLYAYFSSRRRYGVVANNRKQVKDMYLIPLGSVEKIPHQIVPFDGPGLETNRPNLLLGLIIRQRPKRDYGVLLPNEASEPPRLLVENKSQVEPIQKAVVTRDEEKDFISSLGLKQEKDSVNVNKSTVTESGLDMEDEENVLLRFLPGVLKQPASEKSILACDEVKNTTSCTVGQTSDTDRDTSGQVTPKTPTAIARLDRFIIKKKDLKSVDMKQEPSSSNAEVMSSQGKCGPQGGVVLSLKDKPGDVTTETFLSGISTFQPISELESKRETIPQSTQSSRDITLSPVPTSSASTDTATEDGSKDKTAEIHAKTLKLLLHGIVKKVDAAEHVDARQWSFKNDIPQLKVTPSTHSNKSLITQPEVSDQSSVTQSLPLDQSSVTHSTLVDQSSVTQSAPPDQSSVTQSIPPVAQSSVTQSAPSDQSSVILSAPTDQSSVTQSAPPVAQSSVTQSAPPVAQLSVTQSAPPVAQSSVTQSKPVEDIQTITTISLSGKNEGLKQSRQRLLSPNPFSTVCLGPPPATFPPYHTELVDRSYHPGPVPTYLPQANPAPFIPLHQQALPPFGYPPPPPMMFPQNDPQNQMHAPPWAQAVPHPACFPLAVQGAVTGPPQSYRTPRFPDSSMLNLPSLQKNDQGAEMWERKSRQLADSFKKDDRDNYGRYKHKSQHYERERHKARSQSRSKSRSRSRSRHRHKTKRSREDRHRERSKERHHSSHHRDRDRHKHRRDSDHEKHRRDS